MIASVHEHSAGLIPFQLRRDREPEYRIIHSAKVRNPLARWEFPQGGIEPRDDPRVTAAREFREETGIAAWTFQEGFARCVSYTYLHQGHKRFKTVTDFVGEVFDATTRTRSHAHVEVPSGCWYRWGLCALVGPLLDHARTRRLLAEADGWLRDRLVETGYHRPLARTASTTNVPLTL